MGLGWLGWAGLGWAGLGGQSFGQVFAFCFSIFSGGFGLGWAWAGLGGLSGLGCRSGGWLGGARPRINWGVLEGGCELWGLDIGELG